MRTITTLIHVSSSENVCQLEVLKQLGFLVTTIGKSLPILDEWWQVDFDDVELKAISYSNNALKGECWSVGWDSIKTKKIAKVAATITCESSASAKKLTIGLTAVLLSNAEHIRLPRNTGERYVSMRIPRDLWRSMDVNSFTECVKNACAMIGASYACIDEEPLTGGIYETGFRMLAKNPDPEEIENRLPGIYWWQIISQSFVNKTGNIDEITKKVPSEKTEKISYNGISLLLLQLADDVCHATRKRRLALRDFFKSSLYEITLNNPELLRIWGLEDWTCKIPAHRQFFLRCLKMMPLTDEEIDELIGGLENS